MFPIRTIPRSTNIREAFLESGNIGDGYRLIGKANTVSLKSVLNHYNVCVDKYNDKCRCPFPGHNDHNPSFQYYLETDSFFCYSCPVSNGGKSVEFVSAIDQITKKQASEKILSIFDPEGQIKEVENNFHIRQEYKKIIIEFSSCIRNYIQNNSDDPECLVLAEKITKKFDLLLLKNEKITNVGLKSIIEKIKLKLKQ